MGVTQGPALARPALSLNGSPEGAQSADDRILATYVHGLFDSPEACASILEWAGMVRTEGRDLDAMREASIERIADEIESRVDIDKLFEFT